jgi:DNA-binding beta-propeller fold protein YncE
MDVCVSTALDVYVADSQNRRIQRFDERLTLVATLEAPVDQDAEWGYLSGLASSRYGDLYVADDENDQILKIDPFGRLDTSFGGIGNVRGELKDPRGLAVSEDGTIYVCDTGNRQIVQLDAFGDVLDSFGQGVLAMPLGVDTYSQYLFVADAGLHQVVVFDRENRLFQKIGAEGSGPGAFRSPQDLVIDSQGYLYVLDSGNARVQKFHIEMGVGP